MEKITVKTTGNFQLFDLYQNEMLDENPKEVIKTQFVEQMLNSNRLTTNSSTKPVVNIENEAETSTTEEKPKASPGRPPKA